MIHVMDAAGGLQERAAVSEPLHLEPGRMTHRVLILGGGFGGLLAAKALRRAPVQVTLVDKRNFHLFQPLLYQVATGSLAPGQVAVSWDGAAHPMALVRDARTGEILSFARGGSATVWTDRDDLELVLSDGVRSHARLVSVQRR